MADQKACPSVGDGRNPACSPPPHWQVDGLAGDYAQLRTWAMVAWRRCFIPSDSP